MKLFSLPGSVKEKTQAREKAETIKSNESEERKESKGKEERKDGRKEGKTKAERTSIEQARGMKKSHIVNRSKSVLLFFVDTQ